MFLSFGYVQPRVQLRLALDLAKAGVYHSELEYQLEYRSVNQMVMACHLYQVLTLMLQVTKLSHQQSREPR
jgi:hypothetical protein